MTLEEKYNYYKKLYPKNIIIFDGYSNVSFGDDYLILKYIFNETRRKDSQKYYNHLDYLVSLGLGYTVVYDREHYEYLLNMEKIDLDDCVFHEECSIEPLNYEIYDVYLKLAKICQNDNTIRVENYVRNEKRPYVTFNIYFYEGSIGE